MLRRTVCCAAAVAGLLTSVASAQRTRSSGAFVVPSDAHLRTMLAERVKTLAGQEDGIGIVVGLIAPQGRKVISYGHLGRADARRLDGNTCFEIGSVTKAFTALLLEIVRRGEVALEDSIARHLPGGVNVPERNRRSSRCRSITTCLPLEASFLRLTTC